MTTSRSWRSALILLGLCLSFVPSLRTARGDVIPLWSGASAKAGPNTQTGATATAQDQWSRLVEHGDLYGPYNGGHFVTNQGSSSANASGLAAALLGVKTQATIGNPGSTGGWGVWGWDATATAGWMNDSVILKAPTDGGAMPDSLRLEFSLSFDKPIFPPPPAPTLDLYGQVDIKVNGKLLQINSMTDLTPGAPGSFFDSVTDHLGRTVGTFHIDLPVDSAGESGPFSLSLTATSRASAMSNWGAKTSQDATLSLDGLTFADGTSLASKGYGVSFASGLEFQTVPEPTSVALWSFITIGGALVARRRSRG